MSDYIKREDAIKSIKPMVGIWADDGRFYVDYQRVLDIINNELSADVVEVVRCKDCKWYRLYDNGVRCVMSFTPKETDYCSYGEGKEQE